QGPRAGTPPAGLGEIQNSSGAMDAQSATECKPRILVVDDSELARSFLSMFIVSLGYDCEQAGDGQQGLDKLESGTFDLVITDRNMPVMDGIEFTKRATSRWPDLPIAMFTSMDDIKSGIEAMRAGAFDYVVKGTRSDEMQEELSLVIEKGLEICRLRKEKVELISTLRSTVDQLSAKKEENERLIREITDFNRTLADSVDAATRELHEKHVELERTYEEVASLYEVGKAISSVMDMRTLLEVIMGGAKQIMNAQGSSLLLVNEDTGDLEFEVAKGSAGDSLMKLRVKIGEGIAGTVAQTGEPLLIEDAYQDPRFNPSYDKATGFRTRSILCVPLRSKEADKRVIGVVQAINPKSGKPFSFSDLERFVSFSGQASIILENAQLYESLRENRDELKEALERERNLSIEKAKMGKYMPKELVDQIHRDREGVLALGGRLIHATILFSDLKGFTSISETLPPGDVVCQLNEYMTVMANIVEKHSGLVDKFIGDGLMAVFPSGEAKEESATCALHAAVEMLEGLKTLNAKWEAEQKPLLQMRIGLHSGEVISGNVGSETRMDYTVIGDSVNLASRMESSAQPGQVLFTESCRRLVGNAFRVEMLGRIKVKGKEKPVQAYSLAPSESAVH
ncbi:adenylate/guanylate cyclase domain-containing protein, partial [Planctomycetota bacterium]